MTILVTGGAGYIGAHVVRLLRLRGNRVVVVDNLSTGRASRVGDTNLIRLDLGYPDAVPRLEEVIRQEAVESVIHIAALKQVGESVADPLRYYRQNVGGMANLLTAMQNTGVCRLVFSSSAAAYGMPDLPTVNEQTLCAPINPYGESKLIGEWMTRASSSAWGLRVVNLRYFNVAGAESASLADPAALNLVPIIINKVLDHESPLVFGGDYPTPDGTCIRDYVHISDLASAHLAALDSTVGGRPVETVLNVGTGTGASVLEVVDVLRVVSGRIITPTILGRRAGDPPQLIADVSLIQKTLRWTARLGLKEIVESAWNAEIEKRRASAGRAIKGFV